jgi:hypothetical protein
MLCKNSCKIQVMSAIQTCNMQSCQIIAERSATLLKKVETNQSKMGEEKFAIEGPKGDQPFLELTFLFCTEVTGTVRHYQCVSKGGWFHVVKYCLQYSQIFHGFTIFFFKPTRKSSKELARPAKWVDFFMSYK